MNDYENMDEKIEETVREMKEKIDKITSSSDDDLDDDLKEKAIEIKDSQIDSLYFLSRYDLAAGDSAAAKEKLEKALGGRFSPLNYAKKEMIREELANVRRRLENPAYKIAAAVAPKILKY